MTLQRIDSLFTPFAENKQIGAAKEKVVRDTLQHFLLHDLINLVWSYTSRSFMQLPFATFSLVFSNHRITPDFSRAQKKEFSIFYYERGKAADGTIIVNLSLDSEIVDPIASLRVKNRADSAAKIGENAIFIFHRASFTTIKFGCEEGSDTSLEAELDRIRSHTITANDTLVLSGTNGTLGYLPLGGTFTPIATHVEETPEIRIRDATSFFTLHITGVKIWDFTNSKPLGEVTFPIKTFPRINQRNDIVVAPDGFNIDHRLGPNGRGAIYKIKDNQFLLQKGSPQLGGSGSAETVWEDTFVFAKAADNDWYTLILINMEDWKTISKLPFKLQDDDISINSMLVTEDIFIISTHYKIYKILF